MLIEDLQTAIMGKLITKESPLAGEVSFIQDALIKLYNKGRWNTPMQIRLKEETVKELREALTRVQKTPVNRKKRVLKARKSVGDPSELSGLLTSPMIKNSMDFVKEEFKTIGFTGKYLNFIGDPSPGFTAMVFGSPKMGKSYLCIDFAGYLARNHGRVLYVAKEEKLDSTLQTKLKSKEVAHPFLEVADGLPADLSPYSSVFLDSVTKLGLKPSDLDRLEKENPNINFIYIFQSTKTGQARGTNEFMHDVDVVIEVPEIGQAIQRGRFNQGGKMQIFEQDEAKQAA